MNTFADGSNSTSAAASLNESGTRAAYSAGTSEERKMQITAKTGGKFDDASKLDYVPGKLMAKSVASIFMNILYAARTARFDLLRAICHLACFITKWSVECDDKLHRLMSYISSSLKYRTVGWIGDLPDQLVPHFYADADFAGCTTTQRSTNGGFLVLRGPKSCFPIAGQSKRQSCVSHSTPEAEIVACDYGLRMTLLPSISLWDKLLKDTFDHVLFLGDNEAMCRVIRTGKNPTMRYLHRTHGVSIAWLHERFKSDTLKLAGICTSRMSADIFTKGFTGAA